jgi:predicted DNA-binding WGR domain protein
MLTRSLRYTDAKSDKFWMIRWSGCNHTVQYGRSGTVGQSQTKDFPSEEAAQKSYEKLLAEKLKKGYVESEAEIEAVEQVKSVAKTEPTPSKTKTKASVQKTELTVERSLNLNPEDWFRVTWLDREPLPKPDPKPFDLLEAQAWLAQITPDEYGKNWNWSAAKIAVVLSPEEARFWLKAMIHTKPDITPRKLGNQLASLNFAEEIITLESFYQIVLPTSMTQKQLFTIQQLRAEVVLPLINLFGIEELLNLLIALQSAILTPSYYRGDLKNLQQHLMRGFQEYVLSYLSQTEKLKLRTQMEAQLDLNQWPTDYSQVPSPLFYLAAYLGCPSLQTLVESWDDNFYNQSGWRHDYYHRPQEIIFGLGDAALVQSQMRRLKLSLKNPDRYATSEKYVRDWLVHTEFAALDYVGKSILDADSKQEAEKIIKEFVACVQAPEVAPVMLELMLSSKAPKIARKWLDDHLGNAIAGLIPIATGKGKLAAAAIDFLQGAKRKGHADFIAACLEQESAEIVAKIRSLILDFEEKEYIPFDPQTTPDWLKLLKRGETEQKKSVWQPAVSDLPTITIGDYCLNPEQIEVVISGLKQSQLGAAHAIVNTLKQQIDAVVLNQFAWKLFELWLAEGAPSKENWAMLAVGLLGDDTAALKLAPMVRVWPGENQHARAVLGLECLQAIGTDTALMQVNGIAQKVKFKGIKQRAQECMSAIAAERQMTKEQLEDRIVPSCDLDDRGSRCFDFGSRQFYLALSSELKPMVKDADGKLKADLPKPNSKDEVQKAEAAIEEWKLLKKQINEVLKLQPARLEQAMITGRRWLVEEFETLLGQHPLMIHLVQRLIWGGYDAQGNLLKTFRVTEDRTYSDMEDAVIAIADVQSICLLHVLDLPEKSRDQWGEILSDYEIVAPFPQLGRATYKLTQQEESSIEITRFKDQKIKLQTLVRSLENQGWQRSHLHDYGDYICHWKYFASEDVTAIVGDYEQVFVDLSVEIGDGLETIDGCCFLRGKVEVYDYPRSSYTMKQYADQVVPLGQINPIVISEVLKNLTDIAAKAE